MQATAAPALAMASSASNGMPPIVAPLLLILGAVVVVVLFAILFREAGRMRGAVRQLEQLRLSNPDVEDEDGKDVVGETRHMLRAFPVRMDVASTVRLVSMFGAPVMLDTLHVACGTSGRARQALCQYRSTMWIVLEPSVAAKTLRDEVATGDVRYAAVAGGYYRLQSLDTALASAPDGRATIDTQTQAVTRILRTDSLIVLAAAPAYVVNVVKFTDGTETGIDACSITVALPILTVTGGQGLQAIVNANRASPGRANTLLMHMWAHGWRG